MKKIILIITLSATLLQACNSAKDTKSQNGQTTTSNSTAENSIELAKNDSSDIQDKVQQNNWWVGKHFVSSRPASNRPEEGGSDFMIINSDGTAAYKIGDMVLNAQWKTEKNNLILFGELLSNEVNFKIENNTLVDEFGTKWVEKN